MKTLILKIVFAIFAVVSSMTMAADEQWSIYSEVKVPDDAKPVSADEASILLKIAHGKGEYVGFTTTSNGLSHLATRAFNEGDSTYFLYYFEQAYNKKEKYSQGFLSLIKINGNYFNCSRIIRASLNWKTGKLNPLRTTWETCTDEAEPIKPGSNLDGIYKMVLEKPWAGKKITP